MKTNLIEKCVIPAGIKEIKNPCRDTYDEADVGVFERLGLAMSGRAVNEIIANKAAYGFDEAPAMATTPTVATPIQFLQWWSPKVIRTLYGKRMSDILTPTTVSGNWEDVEVVIPEIETLGDVVLYGDYANGNNSSYNPNFNKRSIVRFMSTVQVGILEEAQASKMPMREGGAKTNKMIAAMNAMEIERNLTYFNGFLVGTVANYGLLNDPRLPSYGTLPVGAAGSTTWASKNYVEQINDIRTMVQALETKMRGNFTSAIDSFTIAIPQSVSQTMTSVTPYGNASANSVSAWIKESYPNARVVLVPQFDNALGGENVVYVWKDEVDGDSCIDQFVPAKAFLVGFERRDTYTKETYSNATAGCFVGYGVGVVRYVGC